MLVTLGSVSFYDHQYRLIETILILNGENYELHNLMGFDPRREGHYRLFNKVIQTDVKIKEDQNDAILDQYYLIRYVEDISHPDVYYNETEAELIRELVDRSNKKIFCPPDHDNSNLLIIYQKVGSISLRDHILRFSPNIKFGQPILVIDELSRNHYYFWDGLRPIGLTGDSIPSKMICRDGQPLDMYCRYISKQILWPSESMRKIVYNLSFNKGIAKYTCSGHEYIFVRPDEFSGVDMMLGSWEITSDSNGTTVISLHHMKYN